jgi:hypothetical protein
MASTSPLVKPCRSSARMFSSLTGCCCSGCNTKGATQLPYLGSLAFLEMENSSILTRSRTSLVRFAHTYASCINQLCIRLFFALSAVMSFVMMVADCTYAYANAPSPGQPSYVRIDDAYADWYRSRHTKEADRSLVLPALKALQGHPEAGALWESTSTRFSTTSISYTTHTSEASTEVRSTGMSSFCAE